MLMFDHTCIRHFTIGIIDNRIPLIIVTVKCLRLKSHRTILKRSESVTKIFIDHPRKYDLVCNIRILSTKFKKVCSRKNIRFFKHFFHDRSIAADRDSLISVVEIIVVIHKTKRKPLNDKCRKFRTFSSPLLLCISLDQFFVNILPTEEKRLLLKVFRFCYPRLFSLSFDDLLCLFRCFYSPHPAECVHIKRQIIQLVFINCYRRINIVIKLRKLIYIIPYFFIRRMENMRSVLMHMNPFYIFTVNISGNVISFIDHKT